MRNTVNLADKEALRELFVKVAESRTKSQYKAYDLKPVEVEEKKIQSNSL